jgi:16S rRNA (cytosine967-C5)-methyltransferase
MKIHRPVADEIIKALNSIFVPTEDGKTYYADKVLERLFKYNKKLGARDRRFIAENVYGIVRWWRLIGAALGLDLRKPNHRDLWQVFGAYLLMQDIKDLEFPHWAELNALDPAKLHAGREKANQNPAVRESVPDWLFDLCRDELGRDAWLEMLPALNEPAPVILRANRLKTTREELQIELRREDIDAFPAVDANDALILRERKNVFTTESFKFGFFEVQDGASQAAAVLLAPQPGDRVVDGCAGAGGKTLHMAALMRNKGKIIATDIHQSKLEELRKRCSRAGVDIVETRLIDTNKIIKRMEKTADRVLLDVPCSGLGVLRRNPDTKWKLKPEDLPRLRALQAEILSTYSAMVKVGGRMVYSTCSILPSENEKQVEAFLAASEGKWKLVEDHKFFPGKNGFDGFYAAALERLG